MVCQKTQKTPNPLSVLLPETLKDFGARVCSSTSQRTLHLPAGRGPEAGQGAFGLQLRNDGRSKPKGNVLGRSQQQNRVKSGQLIRIHFTGYLRSEGWKKRKST